MQYSLYRDITFYAVWCIKRSILNSKNLSYGSCPGRYSLNIFIITFIVIRNEIELNSKLPIFSIRNLTRIVIKNWKKEKKNSFRPSHFTISIFLLFIKFRRNSVSHPPIQRPEKPITNVQSEKRKGEKKKWRGPSKKVLRRRRKKKRKEKKGKENSVRHPSHRPPSNDNKRRSNTPAYRSVNK